VTTKLQEVTHDRTEAERSLNVDIMGLTAARRGAEFAQKGDYERARLHTYAAARTIQRSLETNGAEINLNPHYQNYLSTVDRMDKQLRVVQMTERSLPMFLEPRVESMDDEDDAEDEGRESVRTQRKAARAENDELSSTLWQFKSANTKSYKK